MSQPLYPEPEEPVTGADHLRPVPGQNMSPGQGVSPDATARQGVASPGDIRASTVERERVALVLQTAMAEGRITPDELSERLGIVYQAKTLGELEPVTRDLPEHRPLVDVTKAPVPPSRPTEAATGSYMSSSAIAVMSGSERKGVWSVPETFTAVAIMGGVEVDLTEAVFLAGEVTITAFAFWGGIDILVPDDVLVREEGVAIMGGFDSEVPPSSELPRAIVRVRGAALMGGVEVRRLTEKERRKREKKRRKRLERGGY